MADAPDAPARVRPSPPWWRHPRRCAGDRSPSCYVKCSRPGCAWAERPTARHSLYYSLTRTVGGRTQSRFVPAAQAARVRQQIAAGQQFRRHVDAFWDACELLG